MNKVKISNKIMCKYLKYTARNSKTKADYSKPEKRIILLLQS